MPPCGTQPPGLLGVPWLLPHAHMVPNMCYDTNWVNHPLRQEPGERFEKARGDIAFLMIAPSTNPEGDQVFSLAVVWAHPCQGCLSTLVEAAQKLMLLADNGPDWPYTFVHMSDTVLHVPLSGNRHIGAMTDSVHSVNTCGWLHQLQVWKLL